MSRTAWVARRHAPALPAKPPGVFHTSTRPLGRRPRRPAEPGGCPVVAEITLVHAGRQRVVPLVARHAEGTGEKAVAATDASVIPPDHRAASRFLQRGDRADRNAGRFQAVHALTFHGDMAHRSVEHGGVAEIHKRP